MVKTDETYPRHAIRRTTTNEDDRKIYKIKNKKVATSSMSIVNATLYMLYHIHEFVDTKNVNGLNFEQYI